MGTTEVPNRKACAAKRGAGFMTREERSVRELDSPLAYFRLEDTLCRRYLELAADRREFEGLKLLFPFVRELAVLRVPRDLESISSWMRLAFLAGHDLGRAHPEWVEVVLPGRELPEAAKRVGIIQRRSGEEKFSYDGLQRACERIAGENWGETPKGKAEAVLVEATVKSLRAGFAAATVCRVDPVGCEFVWDMPQRFGATTESLVLRAVLGVALQAVDKPVSALLEHPLLRMARGLYPNPHEPREREALLGFLRGRLRALRVRSENECPCSEADLVDWVKAGLDYGRRLKEEQPELVEQVLAEAAGEGLEGTIEVVQEVVAEAGGTDPARLLGPLKQWAEDVHGLGVPRFYAEELARVACFSDFAVWIPWVARTGRSKAGGCHGVERGVTE